MEGVDVGESTATCSHPRCHNFSRSEVEAVSIAKISVSGAAVLGCVLVIALIILFKDTSKFVFRLVLYIMLTDLFQSVMFILEQVPVHTVNSYGDQPSIINGTGSLCSAFAFLSQVSTWMELLTVLWVITYLLVLTLFDYKANTKRHEVLGLLIVIFLPFACYQLDSIR